jgi:putative transposase
MTRRTPEEWQQLIDAQEASDMTIAQFCHTHHVNQSTFYLQRKKRQELALPHQDNGCQLIPWRHIKQIRDSGK